MDALLLARIQFAVNISFHILFPLITIALAWALFFMRLRWLRSREDIWLDAYRLWTKVFALSFALGVVSGITMSFQFGTNWPGFIERAGNVAGPLLAYEVLTAFFLEAGFLGIMLFGHDRVSERVHLLATFFVAAGTTLSAFWILGLNSWMQTPAGYAIVDGEFHVTDWLAVLFNPSFPYRLTHMLIASGITVCFLMAGLSAWQLLRDRANAGTGAVMRMALRVAAVLVPLQAVVGDMHGLNTLAHQPQKVAAMEALWETRGEAPLVLLAWPDEASRSNRFEIAIPLLGSLILKHDTQGVVRGLNDFPGAHPPVAPVFFAFRVMVGTALLMWATSWAALWLARRAGEVTRLPRSMLWLLAGMTFSGWVASLAGWYVTEIGRQPFVIYGLVRTADVVSATPASNVALTLTAYVVTYTLLLLAFVTVLKHLAEKREAPATAETPAPAAQTEETRT